MAACRVTFGDDLQYRCDTDADCGGGGYVCIEQPAKHCCLPSGDEVCGDGVDNDCDGNVDGQGRVEVCNGKDDNCDGRTDEGFNLVSDLLNCGRCGTVCQTREICASGVCTALIENNCRDGIDNDGNGPIDCADPGCAGEACDVGCVCRAGAKAEGSCTDTMDNDGDGATDCVDTDCLGKSCGPGCSCKMGGGHAESNCYDALDNDGDGPIDCMDSDCIGAACSPAPLFFTCSATNQCNCNGGQQVLETGTALCADGLDNDCNGKTDCGEMNCNSQPCTRDGGAGSCTQLMCQ